MLWEHVDDTELRRVNSAEVGLLHWKK